MLASSLRVRTSEEMLAPISISQLLLAERPSLNGVVQQSHCHEFVIEPGLVKHPRDLDDVIEEVAPVGGPALLSRGLRRPGNTPRPRAGSH